MVEIKKAPEEANDIMQDMIKYAENQIKKLSVENKALLSDISNRIFNEVEPRSFDEMVFLITFNVCKMKMRNDNHDTHKLILADTFTHFSTFKEVWNGNNS
jgi:uncharacterized protein (UPF0335 family)